MTAVDSVLPFADRSFETVIILEVLEHVANVRMLLSEAFRIARKNVLITVPNSAEIEIMKSNDVTYAHMLSSDHLHFFDSNSLTLLLKEYAASVTVEPSDPIYPFWFSARSVPFYALRLLYKLKLFKPRFFSRLYAVASVRQD